eukprot:10116458-Lingulodinium_polyedra.AAC.1
MANNTGTDFAGDVVCIGRHCGPRRLRLGGARVEPRARKGRTARLQPSSSSSSTTITIVRIILVRLVAVVVV